MATGDRTITVVRKVRRDKLSAASSAEPTTFDLVNVSILPRQALETDRGWVNIEGYDIWVLPTSVVILADTTTRQYQDDDVLSSDFIEIDGGEWQVDGPDAVFTKRGAFAGAKIQVKRVGT
jgi:hypothetical protein